MWKLRAALGEFCAGGMLRKEIQRGDCFGGLMTCVPLPFPRENALQTRCHIKCHEQTTPEKCVSKSHQVGCWAPHSSEAFWYYVISHMLWHGGPDLQNNRETVLRSLIAFIICALHNTFVNKSFKNFWTIGENSALDNHDLFDFLPFVVHQKASREKKQRTKSWDSFSLYTQSCCHDIKSLFLLLLS